MQHPLLSLAQFAKDNPPRNFGNGPWVEASNAELHPAPAVRLRVAVDQPAEVGYGLWRDEALAEAGICAAEVDSLEFAEGLAAVLVPKLSHENLEHLVNVLTRELHTWER